MARVLLAWELGGNRGHVAKLSAVAERLAARGHRLSFAVQRPDKLRSLRALAEAATIRQAPVWPGLLAAEARGQSGLAATWGDLLAGMGLADSGVAEYLVRAWDSLLADDRPDVVVAEFAPAVQLAAGARVPVIALGTGFTVPPADGQGFPAFLPDAAPVFDEDALLQVVNHALRRTGRKPLSRLAALAASDAACPATFRELDPYAAHRRTPEVPPFLPEDCGTAGAGTGVFAYLPGRMPRASALIAALALLPARGVPVAAHLPDLDGAGARALSAAGVLLHAAPVPPARIARMAGLLVTNGGHGLMSAALVAGLPMVVAPVDSEKRLNASAAERLGVAHVVVPAGQAPETLADAIAAGARDASLRLAASRHAAGFRSRRGDPAGAIADLVEKFCRG